MKSMHWYVKEVIAYNDFKLKIQGINFYILSKAWKRNLIAWEHILEKKRNQKAFNLECSAVPSFFIIVYIGCIFLLGNGWAIDNIKLNHTSHSLDIKARDTKIPHSQTASPVK